MPLEFLKFKFTQKTSGKQFCRYQILSNNPYSEQQVYNGNAVRYQIRQKNRQQFVYALNNEYIFTYKEITNMPVFKDGVQLKLVNANEYIPLAEETLDLYRQWVKYFVFCRMKRFCDKISNKYDYRAENKYKELLFSDVESGIDIKRVFAVDAEVLTNGTAYLSVEIKCEFESKDTIYDYICKGREIAGLTVCCQWQSFDKTYTITEQHKETIQQEINGFQLYQYWKDTQPWRLQGIDISTPAVSVWDDKKKRSGIYIPQSLKPIITREYLAVHYRNLSKKVDRYTKLSMKKRLEEIQAFLNNLNFFGIVIDIHPVCTSTFGYVEYHPVQNMPNLVVGNQKRIKFSEKYKAFYRGYGFYRPPETKIVAAYLGYGEKESDYNTAKSSHDVVQAILDYTKGKVHQTVDNRLNPSMLPLAFYRGQSFHYNAGDALSYRERAQEIKAVSAVNFVISTLPIEADEEEFFQDSVDSPYDSYKRAFADLNLPSQMVSINMAKDLNTKNAAYRLQNIVLGILSKSGGVPWILESPMDGVDCFIGLDVGTQEKGIHYPACSVCLDGRGNLMGYYATSIAQSGEKIDTSSLQTIFDNVLIAYKNKNGSYPNHVVIHRDGFSNEENQWYQAYFGRRGILFDLVEIRKNISTRLLDLHQLTNEMNPISGTAVIKGNEAYLISTDVKPYLGAPRPLLLVHRYGDLSMQQIVRQVYVLSEMHVGSMRTSRLPITTLYADKICKHHNYVPHDTLSNQLYFI